MANKKPDNIIKKQNGAASAKSGSRAKKEKRTGSGLTPFSPCEIARLHECAKRHGRAAAETQSPFSFLEEVQQLEVDRIRIPNSKGKILYSYYFRPYIPNLPEEFWATVPEEAWRPCKYPTTGYDAEHWVKSWEAKGYHMEISQLSGGITCFYMRFRGERIALWFNAWTSKTYVIKGDYTYHEAIAVYEGENDA